MEPDKLAKEHWVYIEELLRTHREKQEVIEMISFHYQTAFIHGWKHAKEDKT